MFKWLLVAIIKSSIANFKSRFECDEIYKMNKIVTIETVTKQYLSTVEKLPSKEL